MCEAKEHKEFVDEVLADVDEMFSQADRRREERDVIIAQWINEEIDCDEMSKRIKDIKYYAK